MTCDNLILPDFHLLVNTKYKCSSEIQSVQPLWAWLLAMESQSLAGKLQYARYCLPALKDLDWLSVGFWTQFKVLVIIFKVLNGLGPDGRCSGENLLHAPPAAEIWPVATLEMTFSSSVALHLCNFLPKEDCFASLCAFQTICKMAFFRHDLRILLPCLGNLLLCWMLLLSLLFILSCLLTDCFIGDWGVCVKLLMVLSSCMDTKYNIYFK